MTIKTNAMRQLEKARILFEVHDFLPLKEEEEVPYSEISRRTGVPEEQIFKTILARGHSGAYYVLVVQGTASVDLKRTARVFDEKSIELADVKELEKVTGYVRGGCSPVGMKKLFPTVVDQKALEFDRILVSAGKRGYQVELDPADLIALVRARVAVIHSDQTAIF